MAHSGKNAMSVKLYRLLSELFLKYGTIDGVFAHCYLVLSWNLSCRCNNTARIKFSDVSWSQSFDSYSIMFSTTKTDQYGDASKYPRHIYSNPFAPLICPVLALGVYLTTCFGQADIPVNNFLFPGESQDARFANILRRTVDENWAAISRLGYQHGEIGTHSIRKGAVSYLSSLPEGPQKGSISDRAGWSMGKVKDTYIKYVPSGDQFVGRCLTLLSLHRADFATSPPVFINENDEWVDDARRGQFQGVARINGLEKLTQMCLGSILYHYNWLQEFLPANHRFLLASMVHRQRLAVYNNAVTLRYPWNDNENHYSGIPPTSAIMQKMEALYHKQEGLGGDVEVRIRRVIQDEGVAAGHVTPHNMRAMLEEFCEELRADQQRYNGMQNDGPPAVLNQAENGIRYQLHYYLNSLKRVPLDWRFPRCSVGSIWRQWWIGDSVRRIPPLIRLQIQDVKHLDNIPLSENELHGRTGPNRFRRRPSSKTLSDLKFLMRDVERNVRLRGLYSEVNNGVADLYNVTNNPRNEQLNWISVVSMLRRHPQNR